MIESEVEIRFVQASIFEVYQLLEKHSLIRKHSNLENQVLMITRILETRVKQIFNSIALYSSIYQPHSIEWF